MPNRLLILGLVACAACGDSSSGSMDLSHADLSIAASRDLAVAGDLAVEDLAVADDLAVPQDLGMPDLVPPADLTPCGDGFTLCTGACVDTTSDVAHCNACGTACGAVAHASSQCASSACAVGSCATGYADCNGTFSDGCEIHIAGDPLHCGGCLSAACALNDNCSSSTCAPVVLAFTGTGTDLTFPSNSRPSAVVAGDFNKDGKLDLFAVSSNSGDARMYLGDGAGGVSGTPLSSSLGQYLGAVTGDYNNDGKLDVLVTTYYGFAVLFGKGDGTFNAPVVYGDVSSGYSVAAVGVSDLNHDGHADAVFADYMTGELYVRLGATNGAFGSPTLIPGGPGSTAHTSSLVIADWNHDGIPDLAAGNAFISTLSIFLGVGDGTFTAGTDVAFDFANTVASGDIDGDGNPDLIAGSGGGTDALFLSNGNGTFAAAVQFFGEGGTSAIAVGDLNGDGRLDIVIPNQVDGADVNGRRTISVFLGTGSAISPLQYDNSGGVRTNVFRAGTDPQNPIVADFDHNGRLDVISVNNSHSDTVTILFNATM